MLGQKNTQKTFLTRVLRARLQRPTQVFVHMGICEPPLHIQYDEVIQSPPWEECWVFFFPEKKHPFWGKNTVFFPQKYGKLLSSSDVDRKYA